jgi:transcriptional regulator with XRE-family HTH domain
MTTKEIGGFIRERRNILKIQQTDLAEISGIALRTIIIIESGKGNPSVNTLYKIGSALGLELELKVKTKL